MNYSLLDAFDSFDDTNAFGNNNNGGVAHKQNIPIHTYTYTYT